MTTNRKCKRSVTKQTSDTVQNSTRVMQEQGRGEILSDILGSYTGTAQCGDAPEQDADDL